MPPHSGRLELSVNEAEGARSLRDREGGRVSAGRDHRWRGIEQPIPAGEPEVGTGEDGSCFLVFRVRAGRVEIEQAFTAGPAEPGLIVETVTLRNGGTEARRTGEPFTVELDLRPGGHRLLEVAAARL